MGKEEKLRQQDSTQKWESFKNSLTISEEFPNVTKIVLKTSLDYPNAFSEAKETSQKEYFSDSKFHFEIECINRDCLYSSLNLNNDLRNAIRSRLKNVHGKVICKGYNTYGCFERKSGRCDTILEFEATIFYS
ncbi:hypothetical protein [uncultured Algoriphagus sp.]|uniref:hypothetical protein n=1 Tax=uncultured Algoriphagus sp. TaxID=417365 RepID=UPI0030EF6B24|tara:strand:+ start:363 stop:761 length:399 start_codon:yes stop_codon:yes gene_type:complete